MTKKKVRNDKVRRVLRDLSRRGTRWMTYEQLGGIICAHIPRKKPDQVTPKYLSVLLREFPNVERKHVTLPSFYTGYTTVRFTRKDAKSGDE